MKIKVNKVGKAWQPPNSPDVDPLYTIYIEGQSEPQRTYDASLAQVGIHEAETFTSKTGKDYWRTPKDGTTGGSQGENPSQATNVAPKPSSPPALPKPATTQFKADPDSRASIEKQKALAEAINFINGTTQNIGEVERLGLVLYIASEFLGWLNNPEQYFATLPTEQQDPDLPPVELYDELAEEVPDDDLLPTV